MCYKVDSCGLVIGLVDNQSGIKSKELFEKEFSRTIFREYKERIEDLKSDEYLYVPKGYHLFGDYNMALLALIDDFAFPNRVFHAGHGYGNNDEKYALQVISGISTESKCDGSNNGENSLLKQAKSTFLNENHQYPFIGITNYKINNGLLIGNGVEFLEIIKEHIQLLLKDKKDKDDYHIDAICVDCFSNHELTIVYFSDNLQKIASFINKTRTLRLGDLTNSSDTIAENSLLYQYLTQQANANTSEQIKEVKDSHIFATTFSHMGYEMSAKIPEEQLTLRYHWDLKPGHYSDFREAIKGIFRIENEQIMPGSEMLEFSHSETIGSYEEKIEQLFSCAKIKTSVRKQRIHVVFSESQIIEQSLPNEKHPELACHLTKCTFPKNTLNRLRENLDKCRVSKVLKERTLKMYETFNDGITDPLFFNYFIELKDYLQGIIHKISLYTDNTEESVSLEDFHIWLDSMIRNFEQAYHNRFHQSSRMKNISDFNLEYNGGIQQIISAYDMTYKMIVENFVKKEGQQNCVYVSGYERVSSDRNSLRINIFHITYPELYASTVWKEAVNFYWDSLKNKKTEGMHAFNIEKNNDLLFHPDYSKMLQSTVRGSKKFNPSSYAHRLLLSSINENFIHYLFADAIVANNAYLGDYELFEYWYWTYFAQMSHFYNRKGEMDADVFIKFLVRLLFIKRLLSAKDKSSNDYSIFDSKLSELLFCHLQDVRSFADILFAELGKTDFSSHAEGVAAQFISEETDVHDLQNPSDKEKLSSFLDELIQNLKSQREFFKQGQIICFDEKECTPYAFIRSLIHSYLYTIRELALANKSKIKILERNEQGKAVVNTSYASIVSDPLGGIFMCNEEVRSEYFQRRSVFYKSLWGMSLKLKRKSIII